MAYNLAIKTKGITKAPFYLKNALRSYANKKNAQDTAQDSLQFRQKLQDIRDEFQREHLDAQLAFRRECYERNKRALMEQTLLQDQSRREQTDFKDFVSRKYWPLEYTIYAALKERERILSSEHIAPLNVLIAWTRVSSPLPLQQAQSYCDFCDRVARELQMLPDIRVEKRPWKQRSLSSMSDIMNIHYILRGTPTLLIFPTQVGNTFYIEMATWSFNQGPLTLQQDQIMRIENLNGEVAQDSAIAAVKATIGMTRDGYMLAEYRAPLAYINLVDDATLGQPEVRDALASFYKTLIESTCTDTEFRELCSKREWAGIEASMHNTKLLAD